jgi:hypothetical protein
MRTYPGGRLSQSNLMLYDSVQLFLLVDLVFGARADMFKDQPYCKAHNRVRRNSFVRHRAFRDSPEG